MHTLSCLSRELGLARLVRSWIRPPYGRPQGLEVHHHYLINTFLSYYVVSCRRMSLVNLSLRRCQKDRSIPSGIWMLIHLTAYILANYFCMLIIDESSPMTGHEPLALVMKFDNACFATLYNAYKVIL